LSSNFVLSSLPQHEYLPLRARLKQVDLTQGEIIQEAQSRIRHAYFVEAGVVSMQVVMTEGREIEVALVGSEGMVGLALLGGGTTAYCRGMVEVPGRALRIEADALQAAVAHSKALEQACVKYARLEAAHTAHLAACNALHQVEQRLARWILMAQDRVGGE
jgi:CRP-like cAMP-binding protein